MHERSLVFGHDQGLIGTVCLPDGKARDVALVLFNAGVVHRIGPHRLHVKTAREMASRGMASIRFDLHGMGDSLRSRESLAHGEQVVRDIQAAMDELHRVSGASTFALLGFCSGAPQSVAAALADGRVASILLYDGFVLRTRRARWRYLAVRMRAHGASPKAVRLWLRRGAEAMAAWLRRARAPGNDGVESTRREAFAQLQALRARGVDIVVLAAGSDYSEFNYREQAREAMGVHAEGIRFGFLDGVDHVLTSRQAQQDYIDWIRDEWLGRQASATLPGAPSPTAGSA